MTERERLIELLLEAEPIKERLLDDDWYDGEIADIADYLIKNGVVVPPCKAGDLIYEICERRKNGTWQKVIVERLVRSVSVGIGGIASAKCGTTITVFLGECNLNKTVFLTREEAERALKEVNNDQS